MIKKSDGVCLADELGAQRDTNSCKIQVPTIKWCDMDKSELVQINAIVKNVIFVYKKVK